MFVSRFIYQALRDRPTCHCASLTELPDGDLLAVWYAGLGEGLPDSALLVSRYRPSLGQWSLPEIIVDSPGLSDGNAIVYALPDGRVELWHTVIEGQGWVSARAYRRTSGDAGRTWGSAVSFAPEPGALVRSRPLRLASGRLIVPLYDERDWSSFCAYTDDGGATWRWSGRMTAPDGGIQPAIVECQDGRLLAYLRCGGAGGAIWQSRSWDGGETWSAGEPVALPNPNSGLDLIRLAGGELLLAANFTTASRSPLHLALSPDEGASWPTRLIVAHDPGAEFSYPQLLQDTRGMCHLLYTWRRERIRHLEFDREWLVEEAARQREQIVPGG